VKLLSILLGLGLAATVACSNTAFRLYDGWSIEPTPTDQADESADFPPLTLNPDSSTVLAVTFEHRDSPWWVPVTDDCTYMAALVEVPIESVDFQMLGTLPDRVFQMLSPLEA